MSSRMSTSMACKSPHAADVYVSEPVGQSSELSLVEMTEVEYLHHIIQSHIDAQVTETDSSGLSQLEESLYAEPERRLACSPHSPLVCRPEGTSAGASGTGPEDLQDIKMLLLSESNTTPAGSADVPGPVLSRVQCVSEERPLEGRPSPAARVCLEKRPEFLPPQPPGLQPAWPAGTRQLPQESHKAARPVMKSRDVFALVCFGLASLLAADEAVDKAAHPIKRVRTRPLSSSNIMQDSENWKPYAGMSGTKRCRTRLLMDRTQRKEVHNRKERDRRRRIRLCCDELNLLVPFCYADTDKATTLQWTTAFLKYIQEIHGDRLKQVFLITPSFSFLISLQASQGSWNF
uniref:BHLH domain-containing protein n=1 Tax=Cyprinus carpio TaxID=7962 RepID=A0A8C1V3E9_CYPCA